MTSTAEKTMSKKPTIDRGLAGGVTYESAARLLHFLVMEAEIDDDVRNAQYYSGMLEGLNANMAGGIHSTALEREIKAYGIETITDITAIPTDDGSPCGFGTDGNQDRPLCPQGY